MYINNKIFNIEYNTKKRTKSFLVKYYIFRGNSNIYIILKYLYIYYSYYFIKKEKKNENYDIKIFGSSSQNIEINIDKKNVTYYYKSKTDIVKNIINSQEIGYKYRISPKILKKNLKNKTLKVELFYGKLLGYKNVDYNIIDNVFLKMFKFYKESIRTVSFQTYLNQLNNNIEKKYCKYFGENKINKININYNKPLLISNVHGDLGLNNIIISNDNKYSLIDWEFTGVKTIFYDYIFLYYLFLERKETNENIFLEKTVNIKTFFLTEFNIEIDNNINSFLKIVLLERILLELESIENFNMDKKTINIRVLSLNNFLNNLKGRQ